MSAALLLATVVLAVGLFARRARLLVRLVRRGRPVDRSAELPKRLRNEATIVLGQRKLFHRFWPGLMRWSGPPSPIPPAASQ